MEKTSLQITVWRKNDEQYKLDCLTPTFKSGHASVMVWSTFIAIYKLHLIVMPRGRRITIDLVQVEYDGVLSPSLDA